MDQRRLKRLRRSELLELLLAQSREIDRLDARVAELEAELAQKDVAIATSGSIAEASLKLTKVFEEAQLAADIYLHNVKSASAAGRHSVQPVQPETSTAPAHYAAPDSATAAPATVCRPSTYRPSTPLYGHTTGPARLSSEDGGGYRG